MKMVENVVKVANFFFTKISKNIGKKYENFPK